MIFFYTKNHYLKKLFLGGGIRGWGGGLGWRGL